MAPAKEKITSKPVPNLSRGITALSRSQQYKRRGLWAIKKKNGGKFPVHEKKAKEALPEAKAPRFYPADDVKTPLKRRNILKPTKLRASITPGTVLILLAGRFKGRRVVFLRQLPSGLLLVTGPFRINGVPLKRVNQVYVIATSTKVDIEGVDAGHLEDSYFKAAEKPRGGEKKGEEDFFKAEAEDKPKELPAEYIENQKKVDGPLLKAITPELKGYLASRFTLKAHDRPHLLKF